MREKRLDRQLRIAGWDQKALSRAKIGVVGDADLLASLFLMSASALGINDFVVVAPILDRRFIETAKKVNPRAVITHIEGYYTHPVINDLFHGCSLLVDLSYYGMANKLALEKSFRDSIPVVRGFSYARDGLHGFKVFTYMKGREWRELEEMLSPGSLPGGHFDDGVLNIMASGLALEDVKNVLMNRNVSGEVISYSRQAPGPVAADPHVLVVGAGALGIFAGLGLAFSGFRRITFMDPDVVDVTNLNRQVFFHDAVGTSKAEALCRRLNHFFDVRTDSAVAFFAEDTDLSIYDAVLDCVDNFETRIILSEKCRSQEKVLISGGTDPDAGQAVVFDPAKNDPTPAELLGLYDIVGTRETGQDRGESAACTRRPEPSVIMSNQVIAGAMVDAFRMLSGGLEPANLFYDANSDTKI